MPHPPTPFRSLPSPSDPPSQDGSTYLLGRYRVVDEIGIGGMASVHLARMDGPGGFQKWVAIKRIHGHLVEDDAFVQMFFDEARVAARISHPNVATVFELGRHEDTYWIAMEYLHGEPLRELMRRMEELGRTVPWEIAARVVADAAEGLHAAHEISGPKGEPLNLVHRDVTPHNLFVGYDGVTKVVDFGIAKFASRNAQTRAGTLKGKLAYMSPEQVAGEPIDRRTDVFALGVVLWELTTGQRLFRTDSDLDTLAKVQECNVPRPSSLVKGYPVDLETVVLKALAKKRGERFKTARELSRALQSLFMKRAIFVQSDEVSQLLREVFGDRIEKRDAHLRWAAEVTGTVDVDHLTKGPASHDGPPSSLPPLPPTFVQEAPDTFRRSDPPRPAAGAPPEALPPMRPVSLSFVPPVSTVSRAHPADADDPTIQSPSPLDDDDPTTGRRPAHRPAPGARPNAPAIPGAQEEDDYLETKVAPARDFEPPPAQQTARVAPATDAHLAAARAAAAAPRRNLLSTLGLGGPPIRTPPPLGYDPSRPLVGPVPAPPPAFPLAPPGGTPGVAYRAPGFDPHGPLTPTRDGRLDRAPLWLFALVAGVVAAVVLGLVLVVVSRTRRVEPTPAGSPKASAASVAPLAPPAVATATGAAPTAAPPVRQAAPAPEPSPSAPGSEPHAPTSASARPAAPAAPAAATPAAAPRTGGVGSLTVVCLPAKCDQVVDNGVTVGAGNVYARKVPSGRHKLLLDAGGQRKSIDVDVHEGQHREVRVFM